jgi:hypothetical protein
MRTLLINRPIGQYRQVPVTSPGGSGQLPSWLVERYRADGLLAPLPRPSAPPPEPPHVEISAYARCQMHGLLPAARCPYGCSRRFLEPVYNDDPDLPPVQKRGGEYQLVPKAIESEVDVGNPVMSDAEIRAKLARILSHCPMGSKKPLARACGYRGKWALHTLRGVAKGRAMLLDAVRVRISPVLRRVMRGELVPVRTGQLHTAGRPSVSWRPVEAVGHHNRVPFKP